MILFVCGTHHQPFDRLLRAAAALARDGEEVVVQRGVATLDVPGAHVLDWVSPAELEALADRAEAVVAHAGPGSLFLAWDRGLTPIVMPRRRALGEHVDDHQVAFAQTLGDRAVVVESSDDVRQALNRVRGVVDPSRQVSVQVSEAFAARFSALAEAVVLGQRAPVGLLARLRLSFRPGRERP